MRHSRLAAGHARLRRTLLAAAASTAAQLVPCASKAEVRVCLLDQVALSPAVADVSLVRLLEQTLLSLTNALQKLEDAAAKVDACKVLVNKAHADLCKALSHAAAKVPAAVQDSLPLCGADIEQTDIDSLVKTMLDASTTSDTVCLRQAMAHIWRALGVLETKLWQPYVKLTLVIGRGSSPTEEIVTTSCLDMVRQPIPLVAGGVRSLSDADDSLGTQLDAAEKAEQLVVDATRSLHQLLTEAVRVSSERGLDENKFEKGLNEWASAWLREWSQCAVASPSYAASQELFALIRRTWRKAKVLKAPTPLDSRHKVRICDDHADEDGDAATKDVHMMLNPWNHALLELTPNDFQEVLLRHEKNMHAQHATIVDALSGRRLDVKEQCVPIKMSSKWAAFSRADVGKRVVITGDTVTVESVPRDVEWENCRHQDCVGVVESVDDSAQLKGDVQLEGGATFQNPQARVSQESIPEALRTIKEVSDARPRPRRACADAATPLPPSASLPSEEERTQRCLL